LGIAGGFEKVGIGTFGVGPCFGRLVAGGCFGGTFLGETIGDTCTVLDSGIDSGIDVVVSAAAAFLFIVALFALLGERVFGGILGCRGVGAMPRETDTALYSSNSASISSSMAIDSARRCSSSSSDTFPMSDSTPRCMSLCSDCFRWISFFSSARRYVFFSRGDCLDWMVKALWRGSVGTAVAPLNGVGNADICWCRYVQGVYVHDEYLQERLPPR